MAASHPRIIDLSLPKDGLSIQDLHLLDSAQYSGLEKSIFSIIFIASSIGILANLVGLFTLIRNRSEWDNEKLYMAGLAITDLVFLGGGIGFLAGTFAHSPVSYDVPIMNCWHMYIILIMTQFISTGFTLAIAAETYWRIVCKGIYSSSSVTLTTCSKIMLIVMLLIGLASPFPSAPRSIFADGTTNRYTITWPQTAVYKNFPQDIFICPPDDFSSLPFILFQDVLLFWITTPLLIFWYHRVIQKINRVSRKGQHAETTSHTEGQASMVEERGNTPQEIISVTANQNPETTTNTDGHEIASMEIDETGNNSEQIISVTANNLRARIVVYILCNAVARVYDLVDGYHRYYYKKPVLHFPSVGAELVYLVIQMAFMILPSINPFIYFFGISQNRPLVAKAFAIKRD